MGPARDRRALPGMPLPCYTFAMLRIAVLSDIHGNVWALEAVLADLRRQEVDVTVNAGDLLSGPLEPAATADLLLSLELPTVAGNHERQLLACEQEPGGPSDQFAFEHVSRRHRDWLRGLPAVLDVGGAALLCHGTPSSDRTCLLEVVEPEGVRMASPEELAARAGPVRQGLVLCGHSHLPGARSLPDGRLLVNPGSVGLQAYVDDQPFHHGVENGSPHARYAICEQGPAGWGVAFRCVGYDHQRAAAAAERNGRPDWARWLATGRA